MQQQRRRRVGTGGRTGLPLGPFCWVLLCPLNIPKTSIVHGVGCNLNLNISYYCSLYGQRLFEYGQEIHLQNCQISGHPLSQKARRAGTPPTHISLCGVILHKKLYGSFRGGGFPVKKPSFWNGRHMAEKMQIQ